MTTTDPTIPAPARLPRHHLPVTLQWFYWLAAAAMLPWIGYVLHDEPHRVVAYNIPILRFGVTFFLAVGLVTTAATLRSRPALSVLVGTTTATVAIVAAWFAVIPAPDSRIATTALYAVCILIPTAALAIIAVLTRVAARREPRNITVALYTCAAILTPLAIFAAIHSHPVQTDIRQRLLWAGLDLAELTALVGIARTLRTGSRYLPIWAVVAGTLFLCDAWYDVVGHAGTYEIYALFMLAVELPLAALSYWIGYTATRHRHHPAPDTPDPVDTGLPA